MTDDRSFPVRPRFSTFKLFVFHCLKIYLLYLVQIFSLYLSAYSGEITRAQANRSFTIILDTFKMQSVI